MSHAIDEDMKAAVVSDEHREHSGHATDGNIHYGTAEALNEALEAAGGVPNPWHRNHIKLYALCGIVYFCSTMIGTLCLSVNSHGDDANHDTISRI
jgi:hypothetical protein